jgi:hypothetical protein
MCALARDFLQEQDFLERNLLQRASRTPEELLSGANFPRRLLQRVCSPERSVLAYFKRHAGAICYLKNRFFPMWSALMRLLPGKSCSWRNPGLKRTRIGTYFKKFFMKTILKSKINLIRKTLNFVSIQWSYLQAFSISWDYPFNIQDKYFAA